MIRIHCRALSIAAVTTVFLFSSAKSAAVIPLAENPYRIVGVGRSGPKHLGELYDRIATDLVRGRPLVATVYVALCDNDSQGIVPVRNREICRGDRPESNLYWATGGGLKGYLGKAGWRPVLEQREPRRGVALEVVWHKRLTARGELRARGVVGRFDVYLVGVAFFGNRIRQANIEYLRAVNRDREQVRDLPGVGELTYGGASHVVGYIGHDYFYDIDDPMELIASTRGDSTLHKGAFALACTGDRYIRPAITRPNAHILLLNRRLAYPGAWAVGGLVRGLAAGLDGRGIHREAARAFARGMERKGSMYGAFAHGG